MYFEWNVPTKLALHYIHNNEHYKGHSTVICIQCNNNYCHYIILFDCINSRYVQFSWRIWDHRLSESIIKNMRAFYYDALLCHVNILAVVVKTKLNGNYFRCRKSSANTRKEEASINLACANLDNAWTRFLVGSQPRFWRLFYHRESKVSFIKI